MSELRCLTVAQPWAWSIAYAGKNPENRTQLWSYRGDVAIHAGNRWSVRGSEHPTYIAAMARQTAAVRHRVDVRGAVLAVVRLHDVHHAQPGCCEGPWAEYSYYDVRTRRERRNVVHLVHDQLRVLPTPIRAVGRLGLWRPDHDLEHEIRVGLEQAS